MRSFFKVTNDQNKPLNMKENKESDMAGKKTNIYISFLFWIHMGIRKQKCHSEDLCTKSRNALIQLKQETFLRGEKKDFPHDLTLFVILCKGKY